MYAVSADSKGLDIVVGLLADVVLHPRLTGVALSTEVGLGQSGGRLVEGCHLEEGHCMVGAMGSCARAAHSP
jgi:hypothetical protein